MENSEDTPNLSVKFIKEHVKDLVTRFADTNVFIPSTNPFSVFMAGSPGAGKTEFSKSFCEIMQRKDPNLHIVRIDADEIKEFIPYYNGKNSDAVQGASALGVQKLFDHVQSHNQNLVLDGTFGDLKISLENVERSLTRNRRVGIVYIYKEPLEAWDITQKREVLEGRVVPKETFVDCLFAAKDNVNEVKSQLGNKVRLSLLIRNGKLKPHFNIDKIDNYLKIKYTREALLALL